MTGMEIPSVQELIEGSSAFRQHEPRGAMYKVARFLTEHFWGRADEMANALGVLLLTWNQAMYRYGSFDFDALEKVLTRHLDQLATYRKRDIGSFVQKDEGPIRLIFGDLLEALRVAGKKNGAHSPVAVAKALHLLAPGFFPLWDKKIADAYGCCYAKGPADKYLEFMALSREVARELSGKVPLGECTILKLWDEYNYAKHTKGWV